ncbi:IniB N-terminal domain-containing protein [Actinoplanes sp. NPDC051851]|uniref:IniB N-terminal domain-containing protein n=1 Tax=Actinoplanes sp. NPDC051851 TaxID=3154753 RepID=UPI0034316756
MDSFPTLQEFVLNLIYDPTARSAFELDPESALHAAGLGDITAADVQQVIPLVVDSAPVTGLHAPLAGTDDLTTGVANLDVAGAVSQLQAITSQVALTPAHLSGDLSVSFNTAAAISVAGDHFGAAVVSGTSFGLHGLAGLSAGNDPAQHLDSTVVGTVEHAADAAGATGMAGAVGSVGAVGSAGSAGSIGGIGGIGGGGIGGVDQPLEHTIGEAVAGAGSLLGGALPGLGTSPAGLLDNGLHAIGGAGSAAGLDHIPGLDASGVGGATSSIESVIKPDLGHALTQDPAATVHDTVSGVTSTVGDTLSGTASAIDEAGQQATHGLLGDLHL